MSKTTTSTLHWGVVLLLISALFGILAFFQTQMAYQQVFRISAERLEDLSIMHNVEGLALALAPRLNDWRENGEVPEVFANEIPPGILNAEHPRQWKRRFLASITPLILKVNELIIEDRQRLERLLAKRAKGKHLSGWENLWLERLSRYYDLPKDNDARLLSSVDIIPPSLVLAQAAIESSWGRSRFAVQGKALFGQWTWKNKGIIPQERTEGTTHKVRSFSGLMQSVQSYYYNLNTHEAYSTFREERVRQRFEDDILDSLKLAQTLLRYSERGAEYAEEIQRVIRVNKLQDFDDAILLKRPLDTEFIK